MPDFEFTYIFTVCAEDWEEANDVFEEHLGEYLLDEILSEAKNWNRKELEE